MTDPVVDLTVEIAFGYGYADDADDYVWTDVTDYVEAHAGLNVSRGRGDEFSEIQPSSFTVTLDNRDGRFTPEYVSGAYYPDVKRSVPIRVSVEFETVTSYRFTGYVLNWPIQWPGATEGLSTTTVTASTALPRLAFSTLRSMVIEEYLREDPWMLYPFGEAAGSPGVVNYSRHQQPNITSAAPGGIGGSAGVEAGVISDDLPAAQLPATNVPAWAMLVDPPDGIIASTDTAFTVEFVMRQGSNPSGSANILILRDVAGALPASPFEADPVDGFNLGVASTGVLRLKVRTGGVSTTQTTTTQVCDAAIHHVAVTVTRAAGVSTPKVYLDGALAYTGATFTNHPGDLDRLMGGATFVDNDTAVIGPMMLCHVAVHRAAVSAARLADHAEAALTGFANDRTDERATRILSYAGIIPSTEPGLTSSVPLLKTDSQNTLALLRTLEVGEGGVLFESGDGTLTFHSRAHRPGAPVEVTLSATGQQIGADFRPVLDDFGLLNDYTVSSTEEGVESTRAVDNASGLAYGPYVASVALPNTSALQLADYANWQVGVRAEPKVRVSALTVDVLNCGATADVLALDIGSRVEVSALPPQAPASSMEFFIEGISESIESHAYEVTFNLSPAALFDAWVLDDTTYSVLDSSTILYY